jgi:hypothetical protein
MPVPSPPTDSITTSASAPREAFALARSGDTREQLEAFGERLMPILSEVGIDPGEPEVLEIHNIVKR